MCNIWKNKPAEKIKEELTLEEFQKIFENYGKTYWITITGGEPFLRKDLVDVIKVIYEKTSPKLMTIATNGTIPESIISWTSRILESCNKLNLIINVSLDGIGKQHDEIRGFKGNYERVVQTVKGLKALNHPRLTVGINSVISVFNVFNFQKIYTHVMDKLKPDSYIVEIAEKRAKLCNLDLKITPKTNEYQKVLIFLIKKSREKNKNGIPKIIGKLRKEFYKYLISNNSMEIFEGIASGYIMSNGDVWLSYSKKFVVGNLRHVNYDFKKLWFNEKAKQYRRLMSSNYTTMAVNAFYTNFLCNSKNLFKLILS
jgi:MoaA/NifB/PqqE/SkfB family radical SAM enzyme